MNKMYKLSIILNILLSLNFLFASVRGERIGARIHNGTVAQYGQFPFMVALFESEEIFSCSGNLITRSNVLTAATCILMKTVWYAMAGDIVLLKMEKTAETREWKWITRTKAHPRAIEYYNKYKQILDEYNFAICDLEEEFSINNNIKTIPLASEPIYVKEKCLAVGFGKSHMQNTNWRHQYLNYITLTLKDCNVSETSDNPLYCACTRNGMVSIVGDIGGPMLNVDRPYSLQGIFTGILGEYNLYARVYNVRRWILSQITSDINRSGLKKKRTRKSGASMRYSFTIFLVVFPAMLMQY